MIIAFDLDGTISDPIVGVSASINYALEKLGMPEKAPTTFEAYIGPPLQEIFADIFGEKRDDLIHSAITFFRERYFRIGYRENVIAFVLVYYGGMAARRNCLVPELT